MNSTLPGEDLERKRALARYELKCKLEELEAARGRATELISLYIPPTRQITDVTNYLHNEYAQSGNIKSRLTRKHVMWAIDALLGKLKFYRQPLPNGMAFFVGTKMVSHDKYVTVFELIEPPEPIMSFKYNCDSSFYLEPLKAMLVDKAVYGLIVIDRSEATLGYLRGKRIIPIKNVQSLVPSKHSRGGQSARRFERLIEQAAHEFFKKVATLANENFVGNRELRGILVGGPGATKEYFVEKDYLHHELRKLIIDTFDTGYTNESGLRELVDKASETLTELGILREKQLLARFVREVVKADGGLAVYGDAEVRHALLMGAIDTLLISELVQKYRLKLECNSCRHTQEVTVDKANLDSWRCPNCDKSSLRIIERHNIVSELSEQAEAVGTKVELISPDTDDGALLYSAFGGIAAILRYKIKYQ